MAELPSGTVTFLFTDIEGSTALLKQLGERYSAVLADQRRILREAAEARQGREIDSQGDSFFFAFARANAALGAAVTAQRALAEHAWPEGSQVRVRMGLHTGEPLVEEESYVGLGVHRAARIGAVAHGGQVLLSNATRELVADELGGVSVRELGSYRLKDIDLPEALFQLDIEGLQTEFSPLKAEKVAQPPQVRRRTLLVGALAGVIAAAVAIPIFALSGGSGGSVARASLAADSVGVFDARSGRLVDQAPVGSGPHSVVADKGAVWVTNVDAGTVSRLDPRTNTVVQTIAAGNAPAAVAFGFGFVWVVSGSANSVTRIDARSGTVLPPIPVGNGPSAIAVGAGAVWVANRLDGTVSRIGPRTAEVRVIPVGDGPSGVAAGSNVVWVSHERAGTLSRVDPVAEKVVQTVKTGNRPEGVAVSGDTMYVAVRASGLAHRGGTLTLLSSEPFDSIDPAVAYSEFSWPAIILTNDGLTGFKRVGGSDGLRLVPDLATSIPTPTDGGRAYTFQVRAGVRYSTGALVQPADFRRAIERSLALWAESPDGTGFYFKGLVGAATCVKRPKQCDLSRGIVVDPASHTVTFHLTAPDPYLLDKLAISSAYAVPANTPLKARLPLPATGPYMIESYSAKHSLRLVRNPRFHEWSAGAQPNGYPDEIVWKFGVSPDAQVRAVEQRKADYAFVAGDRVSALRRDGYGSQLHVNPALDTHYYFLNTRLAPFSNVEARQAVNYAVDRNQIIKLEGYNLEQLSCQVLPPNFSGYRRYCPYTIDSSPDGNYTGPDLARARQLVAASGTSGQTVAVWTAKYSFRSGAYLVSVLKSLGYNARLKVVGGSGEKGVAKYYANVPDSRRKAQAGVTGWTADYPTSSDFFSPLLTCASYHPRTSDNSNFGAFCNPHIDREIARARALETSDPQAAALLWRKIDHDVVGQAPWVAYGNDQAVDFVSRRVGNYIYNPQWGALLDQFWVR